MGSELCIRDSPESNPNTDPQDKMEGPVSSVMQNISDGMEPTKEDVQDAADADKDQFIDDKEK